MKKLILKRISLYKVLIVFHIACFRIRCKKFVWSLWPWRVLGLFKKVRGDKWFAQKILGWELDFVHNVNNPDDYHFHKKGGDVVRPSDY